MNNSNHSLEGRTFKRAALGKGFNSLMGLDEEDPKLDLPGLQGETKVFNQNVVFKINIEDIEPNPHQPRKIFDDEALSSLALSIKEEGIIQPIIVSKSDKPGKYMIIAGERRWRASKIAGMTTIPAIQKEGSPEQVLRIALIENIQRADLNIIEEAEAYASLIRDFGLTQDQCAKKVGKDRSTITNAMRLLSLPREIQDDLMDARLTMGHGRALLSLEDKKLMLRARDIVIKKQLNVRKTEQLCKAFGVVEDSKEQNAEVVNDDVACDLEYLAETLRSKLRTKVKISGDGSRGKIEVFYFSAAELERIVEILGVEGN